MSALFVTAGFLIGVMVSRQSLAEPHWWLLILPAAGAILAGCVWLDGERSSR